MKKKKIEAWRNSIISVEVTVRNLKTKRLKARLESTFFLSAFSEEILSQNQIQEHNSFYGTLYKGNYAILYRKLLLRNKTDRETNGVKFDR